MIKMKKNNMLKQLKHFHNLLKHFFRDTTVGSKRSPYWPAVERNFRRHNPTCAACGSTTRLNVHHCKPFHLYPELELDPNNLITLCMGINECHLHLGHGGNFKDYCPDVRQYAQEALVHPENFQNLVTLAMTSRQNA